MDRNVLIRLHNTLSDICANRVDPLFKEPYQITLLCRNPAYPDGSRDVTVTTEKNLEDAVAALRLLNKIGPEGTFGGTEVTNVRPV